MELFNKKIYMKNHKYSFAHELTQNHEKDHEIEVF